MCIRDSKVLIIGSGPIIIGQACEFDYSGTQACKALRKLGYEIVLVNSNPATIMTDPETADETYIEPLNAERLEEIIAKERPDALLPNLGGQSGLNLCEELYKKGILDKYNVCLLYTSIRKLRIKFIAISMTSTIIVLFLILGSINLLNYREMSHNADTILDFLKENDGELPENLYKSQHKKTNGISPETSFESRYFSCLLYTSSVYKRQ